MINCFQLSATTKSALYGKDASLWVGYLIFGWIEPLKCPSDLVSGTFLLEWDRLIEIKSQKAIWEGGRQKSPARFFFQNLLILSVLLTLVHLSTHPTPCFNYCTCQKHNGPAFIHQVTNVGKGRGNGLYGVSWSLDLNQGTHQLCYPPPYSTWEDPLWVNTGV